MGGVVPGLVVLGSIRKQVEQGRGNEPMNVSPRPLRQLLPPRAGSYLALVPVLIFFSVMDHDVEVYTK